MEEFTEQEYMAMAEESRLYEERNENEQWQHTEAAEK